MFLLQRSLVLFRECLKEKANFSCLYTVVASVKVTSIVQTRLHIELRLKWRFLVYVYVIE